MDQAHRKNLYQGTSTWIRYLTTLLASSILRAMRLTVELMRAKPARPRIFNFVSAKINTIQTVYVKRKAHKIFRHRLIQTNGNKNTSEERYYIITESNFEFFSALLLPRDGMLRSRLAIMMMKKQMITKMISRLAVRLAMLWVLKKKENRSYYSFVRCCFTTVDSVTAASPVLRIRNFYFGSCFGSGSGL
jgi:hypothetical protein